MAAKKKTSKKSAKKGAKKGAKSAPHSTPALKVQITDHGATADGKGHLYVGHLVSGSQQLPLGSIVEKNQAAARAKFHRLARLRLSH